MNGVEPDPAPADQATALPSGGSYKLRNVFTQSPEKVKVTLLSVLGVVAGIRGWDPTLLETVGVGIAIERTLDLFYVAPVRNAQMVHVQQANDAAAINGIALGKQLAQAPPAPAA